MSTFPRDFLFGAATSSHQIEGSPLADGAGMSNWMRFEQVPGRVKEGDSAETACDHYRRWKEDVELMHGLGLQAYRFSIAWARIQPTGMGAVNAPGLAFYDRLVDALLERGIQPFPTLHHWDLPAALEDRGAWTNPDLIDRFRDYAALLFQALGDRVQHWATFNEPWVMIDAGYVHGVHPPGRRDLYAASRAALHVMQAHVAAVRCYRDVGKHQIGLVVNLEPKDPASDSAEDVQATSRADAYMNRQFLDPVLRGETPGELREVYGDAWEEVAASWKDFPVEPIDFLGVNYYTRAITRAQPGHWPENAIRVARPNTLRTEMNWEVHAPSFGKLLRGVRDRYGDIPLYITENGSAFRDPPGAIDGRVDDPLREMYLRDHLREVASAIADGVQVRGYFAWSLLDNFEWAEGRSKRFGLVHVDFRDQRRTVKRSGEYYRRVIETRGAHLES